MRYDKIALGGFLIFIAIGMIYLTSIYYEIYICYKDWMNLPMSFYEDERGCYINSLLIGIALIAIPSGFGAWFLIGGLKEKPPHPTT